MGKMEGVGVYVTDRNGLSTECPAGIGRCVSVRKLATAVHCRKIAIVSVIVLQ